MWNKIAELVKDPSYKRLGIALVVSALIHAWMFGDLDLSLPVFKKEMHEIEARLQMPKVVAKSVEEPRPEVTKAEQEKPVENLKTPEPQKKVELAEAPPVIEPPPLPVEPVVEELLPEPPVEVPPPVDDVSQPADKGLVINENAYQYVETYFDVHTKIDGPVEGKAKSVFNLIDGGRYQLNFLVQAEGLTALFLPDLLQTSEGLLTKTGLQPLNYLYQFGNKADKNRNAVFDWQGKTLELTTSKGLKTEPLLEGTQDMLSFMYQFMYVAPLEEMQLNITNGKKLREYHYVFEGEENVNSQLGEVRTIHIAHTGIDSEEKTELWLAIDYQYIPVKIRKSEKEGKVYEFVATRVVTTRPTIDQLQENK